MNPKVQEVAERFVTTLYGRIFKRGASAADGNPAIAPPTDRELLERLVSSQPTNEEMAGAFSLLQAELRRGQQRLLAVVVSSGIINLILLVLLVSERR